VGAEVGLPWLHLLSGGVSFFTSSPQTNVRGAYGTATLSASISALGTVSVSGASAKWGPWEGCTHSMRRDMMTWYTTEQAAIGGRKHDYIQYRPYPTCMGLSDHTCASVSMGVGILANLGMHPLSYAMAQAGVALAVLRDAGSTIKRLCK
jgi:hypothetical protein